MESSKRYFLYAFIIFGTVLIISYIDLKIYLLVNESYRFWEWMWVRQFLYLPVGMALASPIFIENLSKTGVWKVNYKKLLILGLPALYLTVYIVLHFAGLSKVWVPWFTLGGNQLYKVGSVILGYVIVSSFYKVER